MDLGIKVMSKIQNLSSVSLKLYLVFKINTGTWGMNTTLANLIFSTIVKHWKQTGLPQTKQYQELGVSTIYAAVFTLSTLINQIKIHKVFSQKWARILPIDI